MEIFVVKHIDLFMPPNAQYEALNYYTKRLGEAFLRIGTNCHILKAQYDNPKPFLDKIIQDPPDCTLSFNGLLPDNQGNFFCEIMQIPHVAFLVDSPNQFFLLAKSPLTIVSCVDTYFCDFFRGLNCQNVLFTPHGVDKMLHPELQDEKIYGVVYAGSCFDYEAIRNEWPKNFSANVCQVMDDAVAITFAQQETSYIQAFVEALARWPKSKGIIDPSQLNYPLIFDQLESYIRGRDQIALLKSIEDVRVDLFGFHASHAIWKKYLGKNKNITIHEPVTFEQSLDVLKKSKISLNSNPHFKNGSHERVFEAMAVDAVAITSESKYLRETFKVGENMLFYSFSDRKSINKVIHDYLSHESKREKYVEKAREAVMRNHTWDHRAQSLVKELSPILAGII